MPAHIILVLRKMKIILEKCKTKVTSRGSQRKNLIILICHIGFLMSVVVYLINNLLN